MMRRRAAALLAVLALLLGVLTGTLVAAAATPNDTGCRALIKTSDGTSTAELLVYDACRFDKIDAAVAAKPTSTPSPSISATPKASASPSPSVAPTKTPTPTPTPTSASPTATSSPSAGAKPGPDNTGVPAGVTLTPYTGPMTITAAGTVIDGKDVTGPLVIDAQNVVIKNSKIHGTPSGETAGIYTRSGSTTITDTEIYGFAVGLTYGNFDALRVDIHDVTYDGAKLSSNASIKDSWIHSPQPSADAHFDGIQVQNGVVATVISGNNIDVASGDANSALFLCPDLGPSTDGPLTVTGNWLNGGNFTVAILDGNNGRYFIRDIFVRNNRFGPDHRYGFSNVNVPVTQSGNVDDKGAPLAL